jgi:hypothetical protein
MNVLHRKSNPPERKRKIVVRWWVVLSLVAVFAGVPGVAAARLLSDEMSSAPDQTQSFELDSIDDASVKAACGGGSGASVTVSWDDKRSALTDGFEILRRDANGGFVSVGVVPVTGAAHFSDDNVAPGGTYTYAVRAMNSVWNGDETTTVPVTVPSCA